MSELSDLYQDVILDHSRHPHNFGPMPDADRKAEGYNPLCGDQVTIFLKLENDVIRDIRFQGQGCAICKASTSVMTDEVKNKSRQQAQALFDRFHHLVTGPKDATISAEELGKLAVFSGVHEFPTRVKCAILAWHTLKSALEGSAAPVKTE